MEQRTEVSKVSTTQKIGGFVRKHSLQALTAIAMVSAMGMNVVYADEAQELMKTVIDIIGKLIFVPAAIMSITGIIQYAAAHSDGDGPAQKKAINMLSAGIMLAALGLLLVGAQDTFAGLIKTK